MIKSRVAGDVWAYNNNMYYKFMGQSPSEISAHMGVIPMAAGVVGSFLGGFISDRVAQKGIEVLVFKAYIFSGIYSFLI